MYHTIKRLAPYFRCIPMTQSVVFLHVFISVLVEVAEKVVCLETLRRTARPVFSLLLHGPKLQEIERTDRSR